MTKKLAWHIINQDYTLSHDLNHVKAYEGLVLTYDSDDIEICNRGLHASYKLLDAMLYAPSSIVCLVEINDPFEEHPDKLVTNYRKIIKIADCTKLFIEFAIETAETVLHFFEESFPNDKRPRQAINAAKNLLKNFETDAAAADAAAYAAAYAAAAADAAADAAAYADAAARTAARTAAYDTAARTAARTAADAARTAAYAAAARTAARTAAAAAAAAAAYAAADAAAAAISNFNDKLESKVLELMGNPV